MSFINVFIILALLGTIFLLMAGGISMAHGGKFDRIHADEFMWGRVVMQAITIGLIIIATLFWA
ncbi:MAG: HIG1 domain-containing protein [Gammaproteobacteria bacterium]|nr:HIG1 domain-containing protein [Gammaproteobacteria bacterium]MBL6998331.1 HIG1 domain-containing protein [Gammaproteobacteria bacterium]